jgi:hypothetical protein
VYEPIEITSVAVSATPRPQAAIKGTIGDGCTDPDGTIQERRGNTVAITVMRKRRTTGQCRDQQKLYDQVVQLRGDFPSGTYDVVVNGASYALVVP